MTPKTLSTSYFIIAFLFICYLVGIMMWPFRSSIIFAGIISGIFYPLMKRFQNKYKWNKAISAITVCVIIILSIFLPLIFMGVQLSREALSLYQTIDQHLSENFLEKVMFSENHTSIVLKKILDFVQIEYSVEAVEKAIVDYAQKFSLFIYETISSWLANLLSFFFSFFIMLLVCYSLLTEGHTLKSFLLRLSPLPNAEEELVIQKFNQMNYVTLVCNGLGGILQGVIAGFAFWIVGIESVLLWATIMSILAFIPLIGMSFVYIPAGIIFLLQGDWYKGLFILIFCTLVALFVENRFKPKFMGKRVQIDSILVFLSIIGGISVFGMAGIFYGPLIITVFLTFVKFYFEYYAQEIKYRHQKNE